MKKIITLGVLLLLSINCNAQCWRSANTTGDAMSSGIKTDGTLWVWGEKTPQQNVNTDVPIQLGTDTNWKSVTTGYSMRVAIKTDGTLWTWGSNSGGLLGNGMSSGYVDTPTQIGTDLDWASVDCSGARHCLAIKQDGSLWVWGSPSSYVQGAALGLGTGVNTVLIPTRIGTDNDWQFATVGYLQNWIYYYSCSFAIKTNGTLWAWGDNTSGNLGDGTTISKYVPTLINTSTNWSYVCSAWNTTFALKSDGTLWGTGSNNLGRLGNGTQTSRSLLTQVGTDTNWQSVAVGRNHTLATKTDGSLWAWGDNHYCGFGTGSDTDSLIPIRVGAENDWRSGSVELGEGSGSSQALKTDGTLWAWGPDCPSRGIGPMGLRSYPAYVTCNSLETETFLNSKLTIYPNPAWEIVNIQNPNNIKIYQVLIYDVAGKKIVEDNDATNQINIAQLEKGIYLIKIYTEEGIHQQKLIKQ